MPSFCVSKSLRVLILWYCGWRVNTYTFKSSHCQAAGSSACCQGNITARPSAMLKLEPPEGLLQMRLLALLLFLWNAFGSRRKAPGFRVKELKDPLSLEHFQAWCSSQPRAFAVQRGVELNLKVPCPYFSILLCCLKCSLKDAAKLSHSTPSRLSACWILNHSFEIFQPINSNLKSCSA